MALVSTRLFILPVELVVEAELKDLFEGRTALLDRVKDVLVNPVHDQGDCAHHCRLED